ncbi:hypothetical protein [Streptomyces beihaiensis]|uniref:Uncharacterized protein n=1 Tax=Streptomyces beihaiensis TaxID=2984495 RepID=A0ABT3U3W6_9ACTN|nr:hypothetical protein [Streptomyces beihaiensis]MCX3063974.1 hypothetical protein [Streptomyces beihaiensis]
MYLPHRVAPVLAALTLLVALPYDAASSEPVARHGRVAGQKRELFGADCRVDVTRSRVTASCHNPYPETDRVALHIECRQWWDIDTDSRPTAVDPAQTLTLAGRCWKSVATAWVSHQKPAR